MYQHPTGNHPIRVNIVCCGPTMSTYHAAHFSYNPPIPAADETWTVNKGLRTLRADFGFVMDDIAGEWRKSKRYIAELCALPTPIVTSIVDTEVRDIWAETASAHDITRPAQLHRYPLHEALCNLALRCLAIRNREATPQTVGTLGRLLGNYLHNSVPYMLLYALLIGVRDVQLFGADYTFPGQAMREDDRANTEYWVGLLRALGTDVTVTDDTTLLNTRQQPWLYGYGTRPPWLTDPEPELIEAEQQRIASEREG